MFFLNAFNFELLLGVRNFQIIAFGFKLIKN